MISNIHPSIFQLSFAQNNPSGEPARSVRGPPAPRSTGICGSDNSDKNASRRMANPWSKDEKGTYFMGQTDSCARSQTDLTS